MVQVLFDVVNHLTRNGQALAADADLTVQQWILLLQVAGDPSFSAVAGARGAGGEVTASDVARIRGVSRASVSALVSALVRKGLLRQSDGARDRRRKVLAITARGRAALERLEPERRRANRALFENFSRAELARQLTALSGCLGKLRRARDRAAVAGVEAGVAE